MKKFLSTALALTLAFNPLVGYCENLDEKIPTSVSTDFKENTSSGNTESASDALTSEGEPKDSHVSTKKFDELVSYLKSKTEKIKTLINKKADEKKNNNILEKQKESQMLQGMSTNQYLVHQLKNLGFNIFKYSSIFCSVAIPGFIYTLAKSNEGYKKGQSEGYNDGKKSGEEAGEQARKAGEEAGEQARKSGEKEGQEIINRAKEVGKNAFINLNPVLKDTISYLDLFIQTLDGISNHLTINILVAGARQNLEKINNFIDEQIKNN